MLDLRINRKTIQKTSFLFPISNVLILDCYKINSVGSFSFDYKNVLHIYTLIFITCDYLFLGPLFLSIQPSLYYQAPVVDDIDTVMEILHQADEESGPLIRIEVIHILGQGHYAGGGIACIWA